MTEYTSKQGNYWRLKSSNVTDNRVVNHWVCNTQHKILVDLTDEQQMAALDKVMKPNKDKASKTEVKW